MLVSVPWIRKTGRFTGSTLPLDRWNIPDYLAWWPCYSFSCTHFFSWSDIFRSLIIIKAWVAIQLSSSLNSKMFLLDMLTPRQKTFFPCIAENGKPVLSRCYARWFQGSQWTKLLIHAPVNTGKVRLKMNTIKWDDEFNVIQQER